MMLPCHSSARPPDRGRSCFKFCAALSSCSWLSKPAAALLLPASGCVTSPASSVNVLPDNMLFCPLPCRWDLSSAEHVVLPDAQIATNKNMRSAAAKSEASFMPALCHPICVFCYIFMNSWPLRSGLKCRNVCMITLTIAPKQPGFDAL